MIFLCIKEGNNNLLQRHKVTEGKMWFFQQEIWSDGWNLNNQTLNNYLKKKKINELPMKKGPTAILSPLFLELLDCHDSISQLASVGECKPRYLKGVLGAALTNSPFAEHITKSYVYKKLLEKIPAIIHQSKSIQFEAPCSSWKTYPNINL